MEEKDKIINVPVEDILPNRFQPRLAFDEKELNELANSISRYGVIQPIVLRSIGDKYEIIAGERRYKATVLAGLKTIPAIISNTDDNTSAEIALLENLQRKNLTVIEEAQSFKKLLDRGFTQDEIATKLSISQSSIANKIRLLNLPKKVQDALLHNKISERHARSLLSLNNTEEQIDLLEKIIREKLTVRQTEDEISKILNKKVDDNDIPNEIRKFIVEENIPNEEQEIEDNMPEEKIIQNEPKIGDYFLNNIPEVVDINEPEEKEKNNINPYQIQFEDSIRKIQENVSNRDEKFYDNIINSSEPVLEKLDFDNIEEKKDNLPRLISEIRDYIKSLGNDKLITTSEMDLPDKYRIVIEINKDNN